MVFMIESIIVNDNIIIEKLKKIEEEYFDSLVEIIWPFYQRICNLHACIYHLLTLLIRAEYYLQKMLINNKVIITGYPRTLSSLLKKTLQYNK